MWIWMLGSTLALILVVETVVLVAVLHALGQLRDEMEQALLRDAHLDLLPAMIMDDTLTDIEGNQVRLADLWSRQGLDMVLSIEDCIPCTQLLQRAVERIRQADAGPLVALCAGSNENVRALAAFLQWPSTVPLIALTQEEMKALIPVESVPAVVQLDIRGQVRSVRYGSEAYGGDQEPTLIRANPQGLRTATATN